MWQLGTAPPRVGTWMISANDAIEGLTPATIVGELGDDGVERLLCGIHLIAPRTPAHEHVDLSPKELAKALDRLVLHSDLANKVATTACGCG